MKAMDARYCSVLQACLTSMIRAGGAVTTRQVNLRSLMKLQELVNLRVHHQNRLKEMVAGEM